MELKRYPTSGWLGRHWVGALLIPLAALAACPAKLWADPFTSGNLVVVTVTDPGLDSNTGAVALREYTIGGTFANNSVALPSSGAGNLLTLTYNQGLEGALAASGDGRFFTLAGYNVAANSAFGTASSRTIARVDLAGNVDVSTTTTSFASPDRIRSAATNDGSRFWAAGHNGTGQVGTTTLGASGAVTTVSSGGQPRALEVVNGQLYGSTPTTIFRTDPALPTGAVNSIITLVNTNLTGAYDFVLLDRDSAVSGVDTLYVADTNEGLVKFSFDGTNWTHRGTSDLGGALAGITGIGSAASASLFTTTADGLSMLSFTDTAAFNATLTGAFAELTAAAGGTRFRGISIVPEPGSLLLGGAACVGLAGAALRRYRNRVAAV